jgi:LETM1-like protein
LEELAKEQKRIAVTKMEESPDDAGGKTTKGEGGSVVEIASKQKESAASMLVFLDRARRGEMMPPEVIIQYANFFKDDLTLDNMPRMQLINMCRYMSIPPYGADAFLRFQLRHRIRTLKEDDQRILWEGIDSLTKMELREACQERGMRSTGLSKDAYKRSLQQWLDLSVNKNVPISLLIMSRTFFLQDEMAPGADGDSKSVAGIVDAISGLDKEVLNEVILEVATSEEKKSDPDVRAIKLEVVTKQNERIRQEQAEREAAAKKKESAEKERESAEKAAETAVAALEAAVEPIFGTDGSKSSTSVPSEAKPADEKVVVAASSDNKVVDVAVEGGAEKESISLKEMDAVSQPSSADQNLSTAEMEALAQLLSADPVSKERAELERIKSAMQTDVEQDQVKATDGDAEGLSESGQPIVPLGEKGSPEPSVKKHTKDSSNEVVFKTDLAVSAQIEKMENKAAEDAAQSTIFTTETVTASPTKETRSDVENNKNEAESDDPIVARLKKRIASMVDKIEVQMSDVEVRIGDKLHILDKDMDGILSREEMASCLQQVLKRKITLEEAMAIANEMVCAERVMSQSPC